MSDLIFGDPSSIQRKARLTRSGRLSDPLDLLRHKEIATAEDMAAWRSMVPVSSVPTVRVTRKKRARRARINTIAPSNCITDFRVIYHGLDALVLNVIGSIKDDLMTLLPMAQEEAKEVEDAVLSPFPPFLGVNLAIKPHGGGTFRFLVSNADVVVKVRKQDHAPNMAAAQVELSAACLHRLGWRKAIDELRSWLREWCPFAVYQPSEVDLCADTQGWQPQFPDFQERAFVSPVSRPTIIPYEGGHLGYVRFGTGGRAGSRSGQAPIQCTIYDKSEEIRAHDKGWFVPLWAQSPAYREEEIVTRIEYRFRREFLKERGVDTLEQMVAELNALWSEGLEWCRYCIPSGDDGDQTRSRWDVREEWGILRGLSWGDGGRIPLERIDQARPRLERVLAAIGGYAVTLQALLAGVMDWDVHQLMAFAVPAVVKRWDERGESFIDKVQERTLKLGGLSLSGEMTVPAYEAIHGPIPAYP